MASRDTGGSQSVVGTGSIDEPVAAPRRPDEGGAEATARRESDRLPGAFDATIAVVVCAYTEERWADLEAAIASVRAQRRPADEIVVVVDHNPDLLDRVRAANPDVTVVANSEARGLSGARNSGIAASTSSIVAFMDDDAIADPDWLRWLEGAYVEPSVLAAGGLIEPWWLGGRPRWFPTEFDWVIGCTYRGMPVERTAVRNVIGCNMSFRRDVFERSGGFRDGIGRIGNRPVGGEETELSIRAIADRPGSVVIYDPRASVRHRVPAARGTLRYFAARCFAEGYSKGLIARLVGVDQGLASERRYATRTLPAGVLRGLASALRGDIHGLARSAAIIAGLAITTAGYANGRLRGQGVREVGSADGTRSGPGASGQVGR